MIRVPASAVCMVQFALSVKRLSSRSAVADLELGIGKSHVVTEPLVNALVRTSNIADVKRVFSRVSQRINAGSIFSSDSVIHAIGGQWERPVKGR